MGRNFSETQDNVEQANTAFIQKRYRAYIDFWEKHIGFRDQKNPNDLLEPYELIVAATGATVSQGHADAHAVVAMVHYSQLVNLIAARDSMDEMNLLVNDTTISPHDKLLPVWKHFSHVYMHLDTIMELEFVLWETLAKVRGISLVQDEGSKFQRWVRNCAPRWVRRLLCLRPKKRLQGRIDKMRTVLRALGQDALVENTNWVLSQVDLIRNFVAHRTRFASVIDQGVIKFYIPEGSLGQNVPTPHFAEQITGNTKPNFKPELPSTRTERDFKNICDVLNSLRPAFSQEWDTFLSMNGYSYANVTPIGTTTYVSMPTSDRKSVV